MVAQSITSRVYSYVLFCLPTYAPTYTYIYLLIPTYPPTYTYIYLPTHLPIPTYLCLHTYLHQPTHCYLSTYLPTYLHTYLPTYLPIYLYPPIPAYLHTYAYPTACPPTNGFGGLERDLRTSTTGSRPERVPVNPSHRVSDLINHEQSSVGRLGHGAVDRCGNYVGLSISADAIYLRLRPGHCQPYCPSLNAFR